MHTRTCQRVGIFFIGNPTSYNGWVPNVLDLLALTAQINNRQFTKITSKISTFT